MIGKCLECGKERKPTQSKYCSLKCYHKACSKGKVVFDRSYLTAEFKAKMAEKAREQHKRMTPEQKLEIQKKLHRTLREGSWADHHDECIKCGLKRFRHASKGLCTGCYQKLRKAIIKDKELKWYTESGRFYGERGVIRYDEKEHHKLQCYICGRYYENLGTHISEWHMVSVDWYKAEFGVKATFGLVTEQMKVDLAKTANKTRSIYGTPKAFLKAAKEVDHSLIQRGWRLQSRKAKSVSLNQDHWMDHASKEVKHAWAESMNTGRNQVVHSHCANCYKSISTTKGHWADTYCEDCKKEGLKTARDRWLWRKEYNVIGNRTTYIDKQYLPKPEDTNCKVCGAPLFEHQQSLH